MPPPRTIEPRILIVEDDPQVREIAEFAARRTNRFSGVTLAGDGRDALELLQGTPQADLPDAVLTDLAMPRLDGIQLVAQMKADPALREIPVAMYSSSNLPNDEADALAAGCRLFFQKPLGVADLMVIFESVADLAVEIRA